MKFFAAPNYQVSVTIFVMINLFKKNTTSGILKTRNNDVHKRWMMDRYVGRLVGRFGRIGDIGMDEVQF